MNIIFRTIWNSALQVWQAAGEVGKGCKKTKSSTSCRIIKNISVGSILLLAFNVNASDLPTDAEIVSGKVSILSHSSIMNIFQSTDKAEINWQSFDIGKNNTVNFIQPDASSAILNRVIGSDVSIIQGAINANGQVFLINPNGVLFTPSAQVNVGALVASTLNISNADFNADNYVFAGDSTNAIINQGNIQTADGGYVAFIAAKIENIGSVTADGGQVLMGAGAKVTLDIGGPVKLEVEQGTIDALIANGGAIQADGGIVYLSAKAAGDLASSVINHSGIIEASSLSSVGGEIILEGDNISLVAGSELNASGAIGGGDILVGGDWQGTGDMRQAESVVMAATASIDASATQKGDGGKVVLWSDIHNAESITSVSGHITATGGVDGGDGGKVETSGYVLKTKGISLDLTAEKGSGGLWLLDPTNITISGSATTAGATSLPNYESNTDSSTVSNADIVSQLNSGTSVTIQTGSGGAQAGDITLASDIVTGNMAGAATLTLKAHRNIIVNDNVSIDATQNGNANKLNITLHSDLEGGAIVSGASSTAGAIQINDGASIKSNGGAIVLGGGADISTGYAFATGSLATGAGIQLNNVVVDSAGGNITMRGMGNHADGASVGVILGAGTSIRSGTGKINITGRSEGFIDSSSGLRNGIRMQGTSLNHINLSSTSTATDAITLSGQEGYTNTTVNASGGTGNDREGLSFIYTDITSAGGVTFAADKQVYNNTTLSTSGTSDSLSITSYESDAFWEAFNWNGALNGSDFTGSESIAGLTINGLSNLDGLTIGKTTSTSSVALNSDISINGPVSVYADNIDMNGNIAIAGADKYILMKASGYIFLTNGFDLTTNGGDISLWSNTVNTTTGAENNEVDLRGNNALRSNGGNIILAGGLDDGANGGTANDGIADGYAYRGYNDSIVAADFGGGVILDSSSATSGGDIIIRGSGYGEGVKSDGTLKIDSGTGTITIDGKSTQDHGVEFKGDAIAITTENTTSDAIKITGTTTGSGNYGVVLGSGGTTSRNTLIQATGANGGITISGTSADSIGLYGTQKGTLQILSQSGDITLKGQNLAGSTGETNADFRNGVGDNNILFYLGNQKAATTVNGVTSSVTNSSSDIKLQADFLSWGTNEPVINTTGTFTLESVSDSFSTSQNAKTSWFTFTNIGGLTIGKSTNVQNVTVNEDLAVAGDVNLFGKDIAINSNLDTSSATDGDIQLKATDNISVAANTDITTNGGDITLWSNSDEGGGYIYIQDGATLDTRTASDRAADNTNTASGGGAITLGGGAGTTTPTAYALQNTSSTTLAGIMLGTNTGAAHDSNIAIYSGGGNISLKGKATNSSNSSEISGIYAYSGLKLDSGSSGDILFDGSASKSTGTVYGIALLGHQDDNLYLRSNNGDITLNGEALLNPSSEYGVYLRGHGDNKTENFIEATGTGNISITGSAAGGQSTSNDFHIYVTNILASSGDITISGTSSDQYKRGFIQYSYFGSRVYGSSDGDANLVTSSTSDISILHDKPQFENWSGIIETAGTLTIAPYNDDFQSILTLPSHLTIASSVSGLTIGKSATSSDGTDDMGVSLSEAINIAGDVNIYGKDININNTINTSGDLLVKATRHNSIDANISASSAKFWADSDKDGDGINLITASSITTSGGALTFGNGETNTSGFLVGGDVYFNSSTAQTLSTNGGDLAVHGETLLANQHGLTVNTSGGDITFDASINSANQYSFVSGYRSWTNARANATSANGALSDTDVGYSHLVAINSRLENSVAGIISGYAGAWLGAYRDKDNALGNGANAWYWADAPENTQPFFIQGGEGTSFYNNFASVEPNGTGTGGEWAGQFFGTEGKWNDLRPNAVQTGVYGVTGYVKETNLAASNIAINSGAGNITFTGDIGTSKAIGTLDITSTSDVTLPGAITTQNTQIYDAAVNLANDTVLTTTNSDIIFKSTVDSLDALDPKHLTTNINTGKVQFDANVGSTAKVGDIDIDGALQTAANISAANSIDVTGVASIGGDVTSALNQNYQSAVKLTSNSVLTTTNNGNITTTTTIDGAHNLTVSTNGTGDTTIAGAIGATTQLKNVTITTDAVALNSISVEDSAAINISNSSESTISDVISGTDVTLSKDGTGTLILTGNNTYTGDTTISNGTLAITAATGLGTTDGTTTVADGATLDIRGASGVAEDLTVEGGTVATSTGTSSLSGDVALTKDSTFSVAGSALTVSSDVTGGFGIEKIANGTLTLAGNNTYTESTTITAGTLNVTGTLADTSDVTVASGATYDVDETDTIQSLSGAGSVNLAGTKTLTTGDSGDDTISGVISGAGAFTKTGTGTLTLSADNTFTGITTISDGEVIIENDTPSFASSSIGGAGTLFVQSQADSFSAAFASNTAGFNFASTLGGLTLGKSTNTANITLGSATSIAGPISVYGGDIAINANLDTSSVTDGDILLKASGNITQASSTSVKTTGGDVIYWSNSDDGANSDGAILLLKDSSITTDGANVWFGGGSGTTTWNGLTVGNGYALSRVTLDPDDRYTGHSLSSFITAVYFEDTQINTNGGNISIYAKADSSSGYGLTTFAVNDIASGSGKIYIDAIADGGSRAGVFGMHGQHIDTETTFSSTNSDVDAISLNFDATSGTQYGSVIAAGKLNILSNTGGINYNTFGNSNSAGVRFGYSTTSDGELNMLSNSGDITFNSGTYGVEIARGNGNSSINFGRKATSHVTTSSSDITFISDEFTSDGSMTFNTSGTVAIKPTDTNSFTSEFDTSDIIYSSDISGLTIGHSANTGDVKTGSATTIAGNINIYGGDIIINNKLEAINSTITLDASGNITDGTNGYVVADNLTLLDGTITLDSASNTVTNLAASGTDAISFINNGALNLSTVGAINGLTSTGAIDVATQTGDLTVSQNVSGTSIVLNAGKDTAAGTATGGNIIISSSPTFTASTGNTILYSGDISNSTGLTDLIVNGSGNYRYNSDETTTNFTNALSTTGVFAVYREQPSATGTISSETITYGAANPSFSLIGGGGLVNGDSSSGLTIVGAANSNAGKLKANTYTVTATGLAALGYSVSGVINGTLTVNKKELSVTGLSASDKVYDTGAAATLTGTAAITALTGDTVILGGTATGAFTDKNADTDKTVTVTGNTISGADADNYNLVQQTGLTADISKADLAVTGLTASNKVYDAGTAATLTGTAAITALTGDTVTLGGTATGAFDDKDVNTNKAVTVTGNTITGTDAGNYNLIQQSGLTADISKADLAVTGLTASDKVYDTNTTASLSGTAAIAALGSDSVTISGTATGVFADKNADTGKTVTVTGNTITGIDAGNYNLIQQSGLTADISKADLAVTGLTASDKVYDAGTAATLTGTAAITALTGDTVTLGGTATGAFTDKNADTDKTVTVTGNTISGADADNYNLIQQSGLTADISKADLAVTGLTASDKVYDAGTAATLTGTATITALTGDTVTLGDTATGAFDDKDVDTDKAVTVTGNTITGIDAGNYNLIQQSGLTADISKADLAVTGLTASDKVYDTNITASLSGTAAIAALGSDSVTISGTATGVFADKNADTDKTVHCYR